MRSTAVLLLVALGLAVQLALAAPPPGVPVIKIGRTISNCGFYALEAVPAINGVHFWYEWMNKTSNFLFENNNTTYYLDLVEYNDASDTTLIEVLYRTLVDVDGVVATFGPWSTALTLPAIQRTAQSHVPFVFTAGAPALYSSGYNHSFGMFVTGLERAIPCFNLFQSLGAKSAVIIASSDPFQQSLVAPTVTRLTSLGITVGLNYTAVIGTTDFTAIAQQVAGLDPDLVVTYLESALYGPFLRDLREAQKTDGRPAAILNSNGGAVASAYALEEFRDFQWALDGVYGATQWSPFLQFFDNVFGSTEAFAEQYQQRFGYQPDFVDALAVMSGFVMLDALERTATFTSADILASLRATRFTDSIVGPISFLGSGKINSTGLCVQLLPPSASNVSNVVNPDKDARVMLPVAPNNLAIAPAAYPITVDRPPGPKYTRSQKIGIIVGSTVAGVIVLAVLIGVAVYLFNRRYHVLFFARDGVPKDANEW